MTSPTDEKLKEKLITSRSGIFQVPNLKPGKYVITFGRRPYHDVEIDIPSDADGLYRISNITLKSKKGAKKNRKEKSALEEQIEARKREKKRQQELQNKVSKIDLLQELINDILAEKEVVEVPDEASVEDAKKDTDVVSNVDPVGRTLPYSLVEQELSPIEKAQRLHVLKDEVNQFFSGTKKGSKISKR